MGTRLQAHHLDRRENRLHMDRSGDDPGAVGEDPRREVNSSDRGRATMRHCSCITTEKSRRRVSGAGVFFGGKSTNYRIAIALTSQVSPSPLSDALPHRTSTVIFLPVLSR